MPEPADRARIALSQPYEVRYWSKKGRRVSRREKNSEENGDQKEEGLLRRRK
jgi:Protein of unknown function (DUF3606)